MNEYFYNLAKVSADIVGTTIMPEWIYCQWAHESANFTSELAQSNHNLGGLCQKTPNDTPQPDGNEYYINFATYEDYADYFGRYLRLYAEDGIYDCQTIDDYITVLHNGGYFTDSLENYLADVKNIYEKEFGGYQEENKANV